MPAKSKAQFRLMQAAAHNPKVREKIGMSQDKAEEFVSSNKGKKDYSRLPEKKSPKFSKLKKMMGK